MSYTTPRPWVLLDCSHGGKLLVREHNAPQSHLQIVPTADAYLIAAAPALRDALYELLAASDASVNASDDVAAMLRYGNSLKAARAALAAVEPKS